MALFELFFAHAHFLYMEFADSRQAHIHHHSCHHQSAGGHAAYRNEMGNLIGFISERLGREGFGFGSLSVLQALSVDHMHLRFSMFDQLCALPATTMR